MAGFTRCLYEKRPAYRPFRRLVEVKFPAACKADVHIHRQLDVFAGFYDSRAMDRFERVLGDVRKRQSSKAELQFLPVRGKPDRNVPRETVRKEGVAAKLVPFHEIFGVAFFDVESKVQPQWESIA